MLYGMAKVRWDKFEVKKFGPEIYSQINPILTKLHESKFKFMLTGSRAIGSPREDSDWDFFAMLDWSDEQSKYHELSKFLDSLKNLGITVTEKSSYNGTIEGGSDHNLHYVYKLSIENEGINSIDIQIVEDWKLRKMQVNFFRSAYAPWAELKEKKSASAVWDVVASHLMKSSKQYKRNQKKKALKRKIHDLIHLNAFAIVFGRFNEGKKKLKEDKEPSVIFSNWEKIGDEFKFKQHHSWETRWTWNFAYWWLNTFQSQYMMKKKAK